MKGCELGLRKIQIFIMLIILSIAISACSPSLAKVEAEDLMDDLVANKVDGLEADDRFINNLAHFTTDLFKESFDKEDNTMVSPLSVMLALAMTGNGADNETLSQMEKVLGNDISIDDLNLYLYHYSNNLPSEEKFKLEIANSIWFRDDENRLVVEKDFLQKNADYYNSEIYKSPFTDQTIEDINNWVTLKTDGMIDEIIDEIDQDTIMFLINAIVFHAEWEDVYTKSDIYKDEFTGIDGSRQESDFMRSEESLYISDGNARGFIKPYKDNKYSFAALLPNEGISIEEYLERLSGQDLLKTLRNAENHMLGVSMPKFSFEYEIQLNDVLKSLGMPEAFNSATADFTRMARSSRGNIYIDEVVHKTYISLDELGTKAGAVTKVEMKDESAMEMDFIKLDRPFLFAIIDNETKIPIFIGSLMNLNS